MVLGDRSADDTKDYKICDAIGGLDVTRLVSTNARNFFAEAIDDVELMREYLSESALTANWTSDFDSLDELAATLDWQARNLTRGTTSVEAGLGYTDDRPNRRMDRFVGLAHQPLVGDLYTDFLMMDALSPLLPWIVDRKSREDVWWKSHQNGRSEGDKKESFMFESLYTAAWVVSKADAVVYYPPLAVYGHPLTMGDVVGGQYDSSQDAFIVPNLPENNPLRQASFTAPYPDVALEGVALITATAPVYFTGPFHGYDYNDTFVASLGVDMQVNSVSAFLDVLQDSLTPSSFGLLVDKDFHTIVISQQVVHRIYPARTGFEMDRVTFDLVDGSIVNDRRNQTYLPSDTILQPLTLLQNADWKGLWGTVRKTTPGEREFVKLNVTLTGNRDPTEFYVMFENWNTVADWTLLVFAPTREVDNAIQVYMITKSNNGPTIMGGPGEPSPTVTMEGTQGSVLQGSSTIINGGSLDVQLALKSMPDWVQINDYALFEESPYILRSGDYLPIDFSVATELLATGTQSDSIVFEVQDDHYPDCFYSAPITIPFSVLVTAKDCGDARVADIHGNCICQSGSVEINETCLQTVALVMAFVVPILVLALLALFLYVRRRKQIADSIWEIDPSDIHFGKPVVTLGEGSFGTVLLAEYRGSSVAVKTIRPVQSRRKRPDITISGKGSIDTASGMQKGLQESDRPLPSKILPKPQENFSEITNATATSGIRPAALWRGSSTVVKRKNQRDDFIEEIRLLSKLQHRNIVCVMGAVVKGKSLPMMVLEYMERGSLYTVLRDTENTQIDGRFILDVLKDITQGIMFLHNAKPHQVVHGDIKSNNILIDGRGRAKVSDFGSGTAGTPFFMAPELLRADTPSTTASDVYALGILLFELYSRSSPYEGGEYTDVVGILKQVADPRVNLRPPFPETMKSCVAAMMHDCLVANPEERPTIDELSKRIIRFKEEDAEYKVAPEESPGNNLLFLDKLFPPHVAKALGEGRSVEPETYETATVVYCEIVGFGGLSAELAPIKIADLMHRLFDRLDTLADEHQVFKIDLSGGGAWMGATNCVHDQSTDHTKRIYQFAINAVQAADETLIDEGHPERGFLQLQVAFGSGLVRGKVVGSRVPRYSLFGPTVDTVSYLAGHKCEGGRIVCTESAQSLLEEQAPDVSTTVKGRLGSPGSDAATIYWVNPPSLAMEEESSHQLSSHDSYTEQSLPLIVNGSQH
ncbi:Receptor-type guanylate cyclase gcy [Seminavis robusta]|uniref:guanylate cyclase n=1 Tax=Seminavis robusta TaxID=568900 RepID=A0A9N8F2R1_9STRA|nr:Receptor-type guanylate cyclase gcy [Seminavis robusta]|eukprot:Sro2553_g331040.1 Receptor-type guanylate cyclase gcy (1212) ;mRNA; f:3776-7574